MMGINYEQIYETLNPDQKKLVDRIAMELHAARMMVECKQGLLVAAVEAVSDAFDMVKIVIEDNPAFDAVQEVVISEKIDEALKLIRDKTKVGSDES